ncbi:MAG: sulfite exporter TauE/SafE family protein [Moorea sp. SIO3G5]|nr:sulfite exporter TauE/SafE family protein [Moorena sp. SIO3G5]
MYQRKKTNIFKKNINKIIYKVLKFYRYKLQFNPLLFSLFTSLFCAIATWSIWLFAVSPSRVISLFEANWEIASTMIFGSMVAGSTSMGGGAVAFPVLTKVLQLSPHDAKVFSLAIQSVGMSAASLTIMAMRTKVEWRFIFWASLGGIPGIFFSSSFLAVLLPSEAIKISFTMMISSFAVVLFASNRTKIRRNLAIPFWGNRERFISLITGMIGGIISGLVGSGMDIFCFSIMVLLFGLCEKISTPTSVILMAINAIAGLIFHKYIIRDFGEPIINYWLTAVPVVVIGAPTGAIIGSLLKRKTIVSIVIGLILIELVSSLILIPISVVSIGFSVFVFVMFCSIYYWMYQSLGNQSSSNEKN